VLDSQSQLHAAPEEPTETLLGNPNALGEGCDGALAQQVCWTHLGNAQPASHSVVLAVRQHPGPVRRTEATAEEKNRPSIF
jgi:hypothetical protein